MGNVSYRRTVTLFQTLIISSYSGRGKERSLVCLLFDILVSRTYRFEQFHNHRGDRGDAEIWARLTRYVLL
jgi:hypothetical protein